MFLDPVPFATLSDFVQKLVGLNRQVPKFLKNYGIWLIDAMFILITWSDHAFGVVESPWGSGILLLLLTTGVVVCIAGTSFSYQGQWTTPARTVAWRAVTDVSRCERVNTLDQLYPFWAVPACGISSPSQ